MFFLASPGSEKQADQPYIVFPQRKHTRIPRTATQKDKSVHGDPGIPTEYRKVRNCAFKETVVTHQSVCKSGWVAIGRFLDSLEGRKYC